MEVINTATSSSVVKYQVLIAYIKIIWNFFLLKPKSSDSFVFKHCKMVKIMYKQ